jgi:phosphoglycerol transferase MdoB-like AlkP superfamily enzyme
LAADSLIWAAILGPCAIGALVAIAVEQCLRPRPQLLTRPLSAWSIHIGLWLVAFAFELLLFHRPYFAVFNILAFVGLIVLVSNAKRASLSEPFIYQDFEYFFDAIRHPRLYLPFFGPWLAAALAMLFVALFYAGLQLEAPLSVARLSRENLSALGGIGAAGASLVWLGSMLMKARHQVTLAAEADLKKFGMAASCLRYRQLEREPIAEALISSNAFAQNDGSNGGAKGPRQPHFVVVQSESFFDARRLFAGLRKEVLTNWDTLKRGAVASGRIRVAAWGANTVRTEFSFLSGIAAQALGIHQFNPYRQLAKHGISTIALHLKNQGYRTICVHPYPASFYSRDKVFPLLGFDEFIDIESFAASEKVGPYVSDDAVGGTVIATLDAAVQPTFVFAITMENHGPLHWEKVGAEEAATLFEQMPPDDCEDLAVYARHLRNADLMAGKLSDYLKSSPHAAWLCVYGDHVPIMPKVYRALGVPEGSTDYCIWSNPAAAGATKSSEETEMEISDLASRLLRYASDAAKAANAAAKPRG